MARGLFMRDNNAGDMLGVGDYDIVIRSGAHDILSDVAAALQHLHSMSLVGPWVAQHAQHAQSA